MTTHILLRHTRGARAGSIDRFRLDASPELVLGRDPTSQVTFDATKDDLVGRQHARIARTDDQPPRFTLTDLQSRNGTFLNRQRVSGTMPLVPGDTIQLGAGGPEFEFTLDPLPASAVPPTRVAGWSDAVPPTRVAGAALPLGGATAEAPPQVSYGPGVAVAPATLGAPARAGIGMQTLGVVLEGERTRSRRTLVAVVGGMAVVASGVGAMVWRKGEADRAVLLAEQTRAMAKIDSLLKAGVRAPQVIRETRVIVRNGRPTPVAILASGDTVSKAALDAVAKKTGIQVPVAEATVGNSVSAGAGAGAVVVTSAAPGVGSAGAPPAGADTGRTMTPTEIGERYGGSTVKIDINWRLVSVSSGLPLFQCVTEVKGGVPVAGFVRLPDGSIEPALSTSVGIPIGYSAQGSGFVATSNGSILTNRHVAAPWEELYEELAPGVVVDDGARCRPVRRGEAVTNARAIRWRPSETKQFGAGEVEGRVSELAVRFSGVSNPIAARVVRVHEEVDVALVRIDASSSLTAVQPYSGEPRIGEPISILGYPSVAMSQYRWVQGKTFIWEAPRLKEVPDPTLTTGNIGRILKAPPILQLTANATGSGNSGGPVFDSQGRVIGIFTYKFGTDRTGIISGAVPIRYGLELLK
jgi:S1-C subfamily serine protease